MNKTIKLATPLDIETARALRAGDRVLLSGIVYTARDVAHQRFCRLLDAGQPLPIELDRQIIYFVGPCPAPPGRPVGSAGPTTSGRMDIYSPRLIAEAGLAGMIGKGNRNETVIDAMKQHGCVYFAATGGAGALIARCVVSCEVVCYEELGAEAVHRLTVENLPLYVAIDTTGNNLYHMTSA